MLFITLNGPAGSGKDSIAEDIKSYLNSNTFNVHHVEFKSLLFDACIRASGISRDIWFSLYNDRNYKEKPCPYLMINGEQVSPRNYMIHMSENVMKPMFGEDVFGKAMAKLITDLIEKNKDDKRELIMVASDGGFIQETIPVVDVVGPDNYIISRITRYHDDGTEYTFVGDSRKYIYADQFPENLRPYEVDVHNREGNIRGTTTQILNFIADIRGGQIAE